MHSQLGGVQRDVTWYLGQCLVVASDHRASALALWRAVGTRITAVSLLVCKIS